MEYQLIKENMYPDYVKSIPEKDLPLFCDELRQKLIEIISRTGGHIGVNLGIIELTVALYRIFDFPQDSLIWDIGHQIYVQKMLTGRMNLLWEIRQNGGSPGYAFKEESKYETVTSSHAGASLSLGLGVALANNLKQNDAVSVAVIGDGAFVEGSAQEALNHLAVEDGKFLVILNDNEMALDTNYGGLHEYFKTLQVGGNKHDTYFTSLNIPYSGPKDGHNVIELVHTFEEIKNSINKPTVLHIKTVKGKGLEEMAEKSPVRIHWNFPFDPETGQNTEFPKAKSYAAFAGETIMEIMEQDENAVLISPATLQNTATYQVFKKYPERSFDVSLAEQHATTLAGGFALRGMKPILCMEATFMPLAYDQIIQDLCINNLPVLIVAARSGHTGLDHLTHHSLFDLSYLRCVPNLKVLYPADNTQIPDFIRDSYTNLNQPTLILYPYGNTLHDPEKDFQCDLDDVFIKPQNVRGIILSVGTQTKNALELQKLLGQEGVHFDHLAITNISPMLDGFKKHIVQYDYIVTMEESYLEGGFGSAVLEVVTDANATAKVKRVGFPKNYIAHGTREYVYEKYGLDADSVMRSLKTEWLELWHDIYVKRFS